MAKISPKPGRKCCVCSKPCLRVSKYCPQCSKLYHRMRNKLFPPKTVKAIWDHVRRNGYVCYYTGMSLDTEDPKSPWYCVFDHWIPGDSRKVVLTSSLLNDMKSDLTEDEFWSTVFQLADFKRLHIKIKKRKPIYWDRLNRGQLSGNRGGNRGQLPI